MVREIEISEFIHKMLHGEMVAIDARSEREFAEGSIPGACNVPLFSNDERAEIGTIYKQHSPAQARQRGVELVAAKLPALVRQMQAIEGRKAIFCWRGGMRSRTSATLLSLLERDVWQVKGGYRAFRTWLGTRMQTLTIPVPLYVLNGMTGCGKTAIIRLLQKRGLPVLDLESLAGHRGSIFGGIGMQPVNQRTFEAHLMVALETLVLRAKQGDIHYWLMEGESRRVGKVMLPEFLYAEKMNARLIVVEMPFETRVANIVETYAPHLDAAPFLQAFAHIERRLHTPIAAQIKKSLRNADFPAAVRLLLEHYYDPRYAHGMADYINPAVTIHAESVAQAADRLADLLVFSEKKYC